jgi:hypothetical protein
MSGDIPKRETLTISGLPLFFCTRFHFTPPCFSVNVFPSLLSVFSACISPRS